MKPVIVVSGALLAVMLLVFGCQGWIFTPPAQMDPARLAEDPDGGLRTQAARVMRESLPDHDEPSAEAIARALSRETNDDDARAALLWLLAARKAPAPRSSSTPRCRATGTR